jgi:outer membrane protein
MKIVSLSLLLAIALALPLHAANRTFEITGFYTRVDTNSSGTFNSTTPNQDFDISFDSKAGYGASVNFFVGETFSIELAGSVVKPDAQLQGIAGAVGSANPNVRMVPLTAVLQWHLIPKGFIDPYVGAGAAYVLFDSVDNTQNPGNLQVRRIDFKDDAGLALNAGVGFAISPSFAITVDGKYIPLKSSASAVFITGPNSETRVKINPVMLSAGLTWRF